MTSTVPKTDPPAAPSNDPVEAALNDPTTRAKMLRQAHAQLGNLADAEEVVDEAIMRLWKKKDQYDPNEGSVTQWLHKYVVYTVKEKFRDKKKHTGKGDVEWLEARPETEVDLADLRFQVERHVNKLKGNSQAVIKMRHFDDADDAEIARRLQTTAVNVRKIASRAIQQLREIAKKEGRQ
jgi:RNA polymerase sigma-70 factor (ECF subfamily)